MMRTTWKQEVATAKQTWKEDVATPVRMGSGTSTKTTLMDVKLALATLKEPLAIRVATCTPGNVLARGMSPAGTATSACPNISGFRKNKMAARLAIATPEARMITIVMSLRDSAGAENIC